MNFENHLVLGSYETVLAPVPAPAPTYAPAPSYIPAPTYIPPTPVPARKHSCFTFSNDCRHRLHSACVPDILADPDNWRQDRLDRRIPGLFQVRRQRLEDQLRRQLQAVQKVQPRHLLQVHGLGMEL